jgi:RluA family pseudouridine synthase
VSKPVKLSSPATGGFWEIAVLFEDEHLLALDKPAGIPTHPESEEDLRPNLMRLLHDGIAAGKPWAQARQLAYLNNAHRLGASTSGVLLLAKNKAAHEAVANWFGSEKPFRKHLAIVWGNPPAAHFEVDAKLSPHPLKAGQMCVDRRSGKKSLTTFEVLEQFSDWSLVRCLPLTERKHQVRLHLKHAGFPVVGDSVYGGKNLWLSRLKRGYRLKEGRDERPLISRPAQHLEELSVPHPVTGEVVVIKSEWPKDIRVAVKYLRQYATGSSRRGLADADQA